MAKRRAPVALVLSGLESAMAPPTRPVTPAARALTLRPASRRGRVRAARCGVAPAPRPWECVVLAVDTAQNSGWSCHVRGDWRASGEIDLDNAEALALVVSQAVDMARVASLPIVLVLEFWWGGDLRTCAGLHARCKLWRVAWKAAGQAAARVITVQPRVWRSHVLGSWAANRNGASKAEHQKLVRAAEQSTAAGIIRRAPGPDEAPAVLIARWATFAPKVGDVIGKRASKASLKAWTEGGAR